MLFPVRVHEKKAQGSHNQGKGCGGNRTQNKMKTAGKKWTDLRGGGKESQATGKRNERRPIHGLLATQ